MPPILNAQAISKQFGAQPLFREISLTVEDGARIGLIGPNGSGKSTLLAVLSGQTTPDAGEVAVRRNTRVAYVAQDSHFGAEMTVGQVLQAALEAERIPASDREGHMRELAGKAGLDDLNAAAEALSGGWRKRLAIVAALVGKPEVLLLDEPTNHLDLEGIEWLEELLTKGSFAAVTVSHDRYFLEATSNEIVELNRAYAGGLFRVKASFSRFLEERETYFDAQRKQEQSLRNRVRTEIEWLRRGPKARTTKSKARISAAESMIGELAELGARSTTGTAGIDFSASDRKTRRLVEFDNVGFEIAGKRLFSGLNFTLTAGSRVGLIGPNGSGKTTLLRLLCGETAPTEGQVHRADALQVVYLSQMRQLDEELTLRRALAPEGDAVVLEGRQVHVASWASRFLFRAEQLNQPVKNLSGGERARVLIARLMLQPADVLLLDEPTNDLDLPTLEVLEENLLAFKGAMMLVSHDRFLLNRVTTSVVGLDGQSGIGLFADYTQWEDWAAANRSRKIKPAAGGPSPAQGRSETPRKKLSYMEAREFAGMEERIAASDVRLNAARFRAESPEIATDAAALQLALTELVEAQNENDSLYERWTELSEKAG
jgi:ATP-binding cassette subfamily F protein uup